MSRWTDEFKTHPFHVIWDSLEKALADGRLPDGAPLSDAEELARLRKLIAYLGGVLDGLDPELMHPSLLANLQSHTQNTLGEVQNFFNNKNGAHLRNANANGDALTLTLAQNTFAPIVGTKTALSKAAASYQDTLHQYATEYSAHLESLTQAASAKVDAINQKFGSANTEMEKLDQRIAGMEAALPTHLSGFSSAFLVSENHRAERYDKWVESYQKKLDDQFVVAAQKFSAGQVVLDDYLDRAGKVLGSVVDTAQAGAYATYANEEKKSANSFRRSAIGMMIVAALVLFIPEISHFVESGAGYTVDWQKALYRLPFSLILFAPALYLSKESSKHRINEVANRRRQHILTTIGPYLALLPASKAEEIKAEVAKSIFADNASVADDKSGDAGNLVAQLTNFMTAVAKRS